MKRPIVTINPHLGDESFVAAFGRLPTAHDAIPQRVATHVGYVARQLRERDASPLSHTERARRGEVLDALDAYVAAGAFPASETEHGLLPTFLDPHSGVRCAVAHLVETTAGTALMEALDRDHHNAYVDDLAGDPRFVAWAATSGLTVEELAWIQPSYPPPPPPEVLYVLAASGQIAVSHATPDPAPGASALAPATAPAGGGTTPADEPAAFGLVTASLRYVGAHQNRWYGKPSLELAGGIGMTDGEHTAYTGGAKLGSEVRFGSAEGSITGGVAVDAYGPAIPRAWSLPVDFTYRHIGKHRDWGIHAGPRFALDAARDTGWTAGLELRAKQAVCDEGRFHPQDVLVSLDVTRLADTTFIGVTLGIGNSRTHRWWED